MLMDAVIHVLGGLISLIGNLMPHMSQPGFVDSIGGAVSTVQDFIAPLGNWVPFAAAGQAAALVMAAIGVGIVIKLIRIVASFLTAGGGSAS